MQASATTEMRSIEMDVDSYASDAEQTNADLPEGAASFQRDRLHSQTGAAKTTLQSIRFQGQRLSTRQRRLEDQRRGIATTCRRRIADSASGTRFDYVRYFDDFPVMPIDNICGLTRRMRIREDKVYVVQTATEGHSNAAS